MANGVIWCPHCGTDNKVSQLQETNGVCTYCKREIEVDLDDPEVVCLCGSTKFKDTYRNENRRLSMAGKVVLSVGLFGHSEDIELGEGEKVMLDRIHKRKIDMADRIHVINVDGYIGESTKSEIKYAKMTNTEVTWYEEPGETEIAHLLEK